MKGVIFLNGKFVSEEEARISALSPALLYGWGLFETMRSYNDKIIYLDAHLKRIRESSKLLQIKFNYAPQKIKKAVKELVKLNGLQDACVRLSVYKSADNKTDVSIVARKYKSLPEAKYKQGFSCMVPGLRQNENSSLARVKSTNYLFYQLAYLEAENKGFDEAIILNNAGYIAEASRANLFMVKNNELFTPALECGCLEGITRKVILGLARRNNIEVSEGKFNLQNLYEADEAFLTNSLMGIMPVKSVENLRIGKGRDITDSLAKKYKLLLKNGS